MISVLVHTYNEKKNIKRCLSSLSFADEILIVDMGSTDGTIDVVKEFKPKIYHHPYTGFVEPARNFGISKARGEWVLIVDADEEIPQSLAKYLKDLTDLNEYDYFRIPRKNILFGKWMRHTGWWPDFQVRFFKKGKVTWTEKIHGVPITTGIGFDLEKEDVNAIVHHNYQSIEQYLLRLNRYSEISAKEMYLSDAKFSWQNLFQMPMKEFVSRFYVWEGYKDGVHGLVLSLLQSFSEALIQLKLWELDKFKEQRIDLKDIDKKIGENNKVNKFWLMTELLKNPHTFFEELIWKLKRKI